MAKDTPKWAMIGVWRRYRLFRTKEEALKRLREWKSEQEQAGRAISGSLDAGYRATTASYDFSEAVRAAKAGERPVGILTASIMKLADHPLCYIGVDQASVDWLRQAEIDENPDFERYAARAKQLSEAFTLDEAF